jgi:hypothetical protein
VPATFHFANNAGNVLAIGVERRYSIHPKYVDPVHRPARAAARYTVIGKWLALLSWRAATEPIGQATEGRSMMVHALQMMESKGGGSRRCSIDGMTARLALDRYKVAHLSCRRRDHRV